MSIRALFFNYYFSNKILPFFEMREIVVVGSIRDYVEGITDGKIIASLHFVNKMDRAGGGHRNPYPN